MEMEMEGLKISKRRLSANKNNNTLKICKLQNKGNYQIINFRLAIVSFSY